MFGDQFEIGIIAAGATAYVIPGVSVDGGTGHTFFVVRGGPFDTSDVGFGTASTNKIPFTLSATYGTVSVNDTITPGDTVTTPKDGSRQVNFLGNWPDGDGRNQCFAPGRIADIAIADETSVPEPATEMLFATGLVAVTAWRRR